jgi:hypothetical protein
MRSLEGIDKYMIENIYNWNQWTSEISWSQEHEK